MSLITMRGVGGGARKGKRYKGSKKDRCTATLRTRIRRGGSEEGIGNTEEVEKPFVPGTQAVLRTDLRGSFVSRYPVNSG